MKYIKFSMVLLCALTLFNCGGKAEKKKFSYDTEAQVADKQAETATTGTAMSETESTTDKMASEDQAVAEVMIHGDDKMTFDLKEIRVKKGQEVKLTLMHVGKMAKNVMGHNFVILKQGVDMGTFAGAAATAADNDYIPQGTTDVIVHTKLLGGGETDVITFDAPEPGTYEFLCSFPGHYALMKGKFIVE